MSSKVTKNTIALDLIEKVNAKILISFNFHIKRIRDVTIEEKVSAYSIGFLDAIEQIHALLSLAKNQIEAGKEVSFDVPEPSQEEATPINSEA